MAWPALMMFKALLLQSGYPLSDSALQKQWARGGLFRRFTGLDMSEPVPDHSSFWRVRQTLDTLSLIDGLLGEINTPSKIFFRRVGQPVSGPRWNTVVLSQRPFNMFAH